VTLLLDDLTSRQLSLPILSRDQVAASKSPESFTLGSDHFVTRLIRRRSASSPVRRMRVAHMDEVDPTFDLAAGAEKYLLARKSRQVRLRQPDLVRVVDLFSGCGGMSLGIRDACDALGLRFESAGAFDIAVDALNVYSKNFETGPLQPVDLGGVLNPQLQAKPSAEEYSLVDSVGAVDFLVGGPPCQGHSNLNNSTRRNDPRNELYFRIARFAQLVEPKYILIENVITVTKDQNQVVPRTRDALTALGYVVTETVVDLWKIGVPQMRRRHLMFAYSNRTVLSKECQTATSILSRYKVSPRTTRWAIGDLERQEPDAFMNKPTISGPTTQARIDFLFDHALFDLPDSQRPDCHRLKAHSYQSVYGRMHWDKPAPTITGGFDTMGRGRFVHPALRRTLTPREAARLQGFPDYFDFMPVSTRRNALTEMIGNAVPPKLSYLFALEAFR
jgi:DNA (cytosine-5)-methyltransferase 1